jgi:hypothetical protein
MEILEKINKDIYDKNFVKLSHSMSQFPLLMQHVIQYYEYQKENYIDEHMLLMKVVEENLKHVINYRDQYRIQFFVVYHKNHIKNEIRLCFCFKKLYFLLSCIKNHVMDFVDVLLELDIQYFDLSLYFNEMKYCDDKCKVLYFMFLQRNNYLVLLKKFYQQNEYLKMYFFETLTFTENISAVEYYMYLTLEETENISSTEDVQIYLNL